MLLPSARDCMDNVASSATMASYYILALANIATALGTGAYSCTLTTSGKTAQDVKAIQKALKELGYRLTQTTTTITILWDNSSPAVAINY